MVSPHLKGHEASVAGWHIGCIHQIPKPLPSGITEKKTATSSSNYLKNRFQVTIDQLTGDEQKNSRKTHRFIGCESSCPFWRWLSSCVLKPRDQSLGNGKFTKSSRSCIGRAWQGLIDPWLWGFSLVLQVGVHFEGGFLSGIYIFFQSRMFMYVRKL